MSTLQNLGIFLVAVTASLILLSVGFTWLAFMDDYANGTASRGKKVYVVVAPTTALLTGTLLIIFG